MLQFKRNSVIGAKPEPAHLLPGELAINVADKKLYTKDENNNIINIGFSQEYTDEIFLKRSGGALTGPVVQYEGTMPTKMDELVSKRYVDSKFGAGDGQVLTNSQLGSTYLPVAGGTMNGPIVQNTAIISTTDGKVLVTKNYVDNTFVDVAGDTMQGDLILNKAINASTNGKAAVTKEYVHAAFIDAGGDTMQGDLVLARAPTATNHAVRKDYVDSVRNDAYPRSGGQVNGSVIASGSIWSDDPNAFRLRYGGRTVMLRNDGTNFYVLVTASGDANGSWNNLRPLRIDLNTGALVCENGFTSNEIYCSNTVNTNVLYSRAHADVSDILIRSDKTIKQDFEPADEMLPKLKTLSVSTYMKEGKPQRELGLIAQELVRVQPEAVGVNADKKLSIYPMAVIAMLVKSVQELSEQVEELKQKLK